MASIHKDILITLGMHNYISNWLWNSVQLISFCSFGIKYIRKNPEYYLNVHGYSEYVQVYPEWVFIEGNLTSAASRAASVVIWTTWPMGPSYPLNTRRPHISWAMPCHSLPAITSDTDSSSLSDSVTRGVVVVVGCSEMDRMMVSWLACPGGNRLYSSLAAAATVVCVALPLAAVLLLLLFLWIPPPPPPPLLLLFLLGPTFTRFFPVTCPTFCILWPVHGCPSVCHCPTCTLFYVGVHS